jgi:hypothetical protein
MKKQRELMKIETRKGSKEERKRTIKKKLNELRERKKKEKEIEGRWFDPFVTKLPLRRRAFPS